MAIKYINRPSLLFSVVICIMVILFSVPLVLARSNSSVGHPIDATHSEVANANALRDRLLQVNRDIATRGLHDFPDSSDKLLTGYEYKEFYDWDLYFENLYLSYFGVSKYDFFEPEGFSQSSRAGRFRLPHSGQAPDHSDVQAVSCATRGPGIATVRIL